MSKKKKQECIIKMAMGKRNKTGNANSETITSKNKKQTCEEITDTNTEVNSKLGQLQNKKSKKKNKMEANNDDKWIISSVLDENEDVKAAETEHVESITPIKNKKGKSKNKNKGNGNNDVQETCEAIIDESVAVQPEELSTTSSKKVKTKKKRKTHTDKEELENNKKIKFSDDGSIEVNDQRKKKEPLSQEDDVKDEDIDKFCDEINEEDNALYEDWIKLLEAKLNSNKKKAK